MLLRNGLAMTQDTRTTSEQAAEKIREVARYIDAHAESLVGDLDGVYVLEGGLRFSFALLHDQSIPTIEVTKEYIVYERQQP